MGTLSICAGAGVPPWGAWPYRLALAGGWIDQPFVSRWNPDRVGSMVVVGLEPACGYMERCGMATGTRRIAMQRWPNGVPDRPRMEVVRELYAAENEGRADPSGSQDMIGLVYPGINRLDYDAAYEGGVFPVHIETLNDPMCEEWLEQVVNLVPLGPRPPGYHPLGIQRLEPVWIARLGRSGAACFEAIRRRDIGALGASLNECMECWGQLLPHTLRHPSIQADLVGIWMYYRARYSGAMFSGCGGGYLIVVSERPVPGALRITVRRATAQAHDARAM